MIAVFCNGGYCNRGCFWTGGQQLDKLTVDAAKAYGKLFFQQFKHTDDFKCEEEVEIALGIVFNMLVVLVGDELHT